VTWLIVAIAAALALSASCAGRDVRGPFRNQYVDAETGKPIEGVVFVAVWYSVTLNLVDGGGETFYEAREVVSGPDGRVEIPALTGPILRLTLNVRFHEFEGDGYGGGRVQVTPTDGQRYIDPTVTFIQQLKKTREERCKRLELSMPSVPNNTAKIPRYLEAVQRVRAELRCGDL
jgi:hypothetical protein